MTDHTPGLLRRVDETGIPLLVSRLLLGAIFIYMAVDKAANPIDFLKLIREYQMVPEHPPIFLNLLAAVLPWIELLCGVLLIAGVALRGTSLLLMVMLIGFTIVVALRAWNIHVTEGIPYCAIEFDCGCGAGVEWICGKIPKNIGLTLLSAVVLFSKSRKLCVRGDLFRADATPALADESFG